MRCRNECVKELMEEWMRKVLGGLRGWSAAVAIPMAPWSGLRPLTPHHEISRYTVWYDCVRLKPHRELLTPIVSWYGYLLLLG